MRKHARHSALALSTGLLTLFGAGALWAQSLTVALYPYVPRPEQFKQAVEYAWEQVRPDVELIFLGDDQWDGGYSMDPPPQADVFVFDAMYFEYFRSRGWLEPMSAAQVQDLDDFLPYAAEGVRVNEEYLAIPQLGCANMLIYRADDQALAAAGTLSEISAALGQCTYTSQVPPGQRGLMVDMSGSTTDATLYLDAVHSLNGIYPFPLPWSEAEMDQRAVENLRQVLAVASFANASTSTDDPYEFATWFSNGWGRAYVGYTESMSRLSEAARARVTLKLMPLSDNSASRPSFYADVIGVHTGTRARGTRELAVQLANLIAATPTMVASIGPSADAPVPQYLMPARRSVFAELARSFPLYHTMYSVVDRANPIMFKVDERARDWTARMKKSIKHEMLSETKCGCDFPAVSTIPNNAAAQSLCTATCQGYGGWNGQWTNQQPAAQGGSVCGCNACPAP